MSAVLSHREAARRVASRVFREPYYPLTYKRTGASILSEPLYGPVLKSHWPLRLKELNRFWKTPFCSEMPLNGAMRYVNTISNAYASLPYPISRVYRLFIGEWRHNRGKNVGKGIFLQYFAHFIKGESKVTSTNLGKIGKKGVGKP